MTQTARSVGACVRPVSIEGLLEANRLGIIYWQRQLAQALGAPRQKSEAAI
jgi:hypothetical protein